MKSATLAALLCGVALAQPACAQDGQTGDAPPPQASEVPATSEAPAGRQVYTLSVRGNF